MPPDSMRRFELLVQPLRKLIDLVLGDYRRVPVSLLEHARKLIALAGDRGKIVLAKFAPREFDLVTHCFPVAFDRIPSHVHDSFY
jgi:hypothetical protein